MGTDTRFYEVAVWMRPSAESSADETIVSAVRQKLADTGANVRSETKAIQRRLAYPVKNLREGIFVIFDAEIPSHKTGKIISAFKHDANVIRICIIAKEKEKERKQSPDTARKEEQQKAEMSQLEKKLEEILHGKTPA